MKKIIHLSDIHLGYDNLESRFEKIVEAIIFVKEPATDYIVVLSGDLVQDATIPENYVRAKSYIDRFKDKGFTVLQVPGNHDYGTGTKANEKYVARYKKTFFDDDNVTYPKLDIIENMAFIGLDSNEGELHLLDSFGANGELGKKQQQLLDDMLADEIVKKCQYRIVYLHHHPFAPWFLHELKDSTELGEILTKHGNVDALLFGHNHNHKIWNGKWGIKRCYDAGSSTRKNNLFSYIRIIDLSQSPKEDYGADFIFDETI